MERYILNGSNLSQKPTSYISLPPKPHHLNIYTPKPPPSKPRRVDDAEISIFDAERYFNDDTRPDATKRTIVLDAADPRASSVSSADGYGRNYRSSSSFHATPTASSEASWNSQSGLLAHHPGSVAVAVRPLHHDHQRRRRLFGRSCPCSGKKSVDVEEKYTETPKTPPREPLRAVAEEEKKQEDEREETIKLKIVAGSGRFPPESVFPPELGRRIVSDGPGFSFPVLAPPPADPLDDPPRDSLEVFRPAELPRRGAASAAFSPRPVEDDAASDTSSDLFEIESFSASQMSSYRRRDSFDETGFRFAGSGAAAGILNFRRSLEAAAPSIAASDCYPPSEVSVEWSVTTAEGGFDRGSVANFSSAASECDELRFAQADGDRFASAGGRRKGTGLLSCVCEKAVSVGPSPVRLPEQRRAAVEVNQRDADRVFGKLGGGNGMQDRVGMDRSYSARMCRAVQTR